MESVIQFLSLNLPYDVPLPGELLNSEVALNISNGRMWSGTQDGIIELGDAREKHMGPSEFNNFSYYEINSLEDFPIILFNPGEIDSNIYRSITIAIKYTAEDLIIPSANQIFNYPVEWGEWGYFNSGGLYEKNTDVENHPLKQYYAPGNILVFKLFSFGPSPYWMANVVFVKHA